MDVLFSKYSGAYADMPGWHWVSMMSEEQHLVEGIGFHKQCIKESITF